MKLKIVPITLRKANEFVAAHHRHHKPARGHKFSIAVSDGVNIRGVVIAGRPVARALDNGEVLEVNRLCTDGAKNACSMLYGAARRAAKAMGYRKIITYTLPDEGGTSLRAAGWRCTGTAGGGSWNCRTRPRTDTHPLQYKIRWEAKAA